MRFDWKRAGLGAAIVVAAAAALHLTHSAAPKLVHWVLLLVIVAYLFGSGGPGGPPGVQA